MTYLYIALGVLFGFFAGWTFSRWLWHQCMRPPKEYSPVGTPAAHPTDCGIGNVGWFMWGHSMDQDAADHSAPIMYDSGGPSIDAGGSGDYSAGGEW